MTPYQTALAMSKKNNYLPPGWSRPDRPPPLTATSEVATIGHMDDGSNKDEKDQPAGGPAAKRKNPRVDFFGQVEVRVPEAETSRNLFSSNVSKGGIFLRSNQPLPEGRKVSLDFETEKGPVRVDEGEVRWSKKFEPISVDGSSPGMGVEFTKMGPESRNNIETFIEKAIEEEAKRTASSFQLDSPSTPSQDGLPLEPRPLVPPGPSAEPKAEPTDRGRGEQKKSERLKMKLDLGNQARPEQAAPQPPADRAEPQTARPARVNEDEMAVLSKPPPPRTRMLLFIGFVMLVAAVTFLAMISLKPFDERPEPKPDQAQKAEAVPAPDKPDKPDKAATAKPDPAEPDPATPAKTDAVAITNKTETSPAIPKPAPSSGPPSVSMPEFEQVDDGWRMVIRASGPVKFKHFTLKSPPRLAIDVKKATYSGTQQIMAPTRFISRLRFGKQTDAVRLVLDFTGKKVPRYRIDKGPDSITVTFKGVK